MKRRCRYRLDSNVRIHSFNMKIEHIFIASINRSVAYHVGQNAADNFIVIDSAESPDDIWFHADAESSSHVLCIVPTGIEVCKKTRRQLITQGALLCKRTTEKLKRVPKVNIVYSNIQYIHKTNVAGKVRIDPDNVGRIKV